MRDNFISLARMALNACSANCWTFIQMGYAHNEPTPTTKQTDRCHDVSIGGGGGGGGGGYCCKDLKLNRKLA